MNFFRFFDTRMFSGWRRPIVALRARLQSVVFANFVFLFQYPGKKGDVYNMLWALVFGFATLNILSLGARRLDPTRSNRLNFGEMLAIMVVIASFFLLGWEMLFLFKVLPIKLRSQ
jgi:hypothetical protein